MIDKKIYDLDYIRELQARYKTDPGLLERVINVKDSEVYFQSDLIDAMEKADENRILIYEVKNCM